MSVIKMYRRTQSGGQRPSPFAAGLAVVFALAGFAYAAVTIPFVTVQDVGNPADKSGHGAVGYAYRIGACEITRTQYAAFLNAVAAADTFGLYAPAMGITRAGMSGFYTYTAVDGNKPVAFVTWYDALRFANWLHNGQPAGPQGPATTEGGAYTLSGLSAAGGRNAGARYFVPTEDEWFKAAYYQGGPAGAYTVYPTRSDTVPVAGLPPGGIQSANFANVAAAGPTDVGAYGAASSHYGTFDQAGNLWEWTETADAYGDRGIRGGSFDDYDTLLQSWYHDADDPLSETAFIGFRIAALEGDQPPPPPVNRAPVGMAESYTLNADATLSVSAPGVLSNDTDADGDALTAVTVSDPLHGTLTLNPNGSFSYVPAAGYSGTDSFTYRPNDGTADGSSAMVTLTIKAVATLFTLTVRSGSGDGSYAPGAVVAIRAKAAATGFVFDRWTGDTAGLADATAAATTLTMPAGNATLTATYKAIVSLAFKITRAEWESEEHLLRVNGTGTAGKTVVVTTTDGKTLGSCVVNSLGKWYYRYDTSFSPNRIRAVCSGIIRTADVVTIGD